MTRLFLPVLFTLVFGLRAAFAQQDQDVVWVQIEAQPSLTQASEQIRKYAERLEDVNGFALGSGWYGVALGPYTRADAETVLRVYRNEGLIPRDSYIALSATYRSQFWPAGVNLLNLPQPTDPVTEITETSDVPSLEQVPAEPAVADETPSEARASEARLTRDERKELQSWLQWAGYYNAAIDGAFGRGTRASMAAWQADNGFEQTGVLTTLQRETLRKQYFAVLEGMDLRRETDFAAGVEMLIPRGVVKRGNTEFPFVHFDASGEIPAKVLLISQAGDQTTLFGLYDIMQTLEIVPLTGERKREKDSFVLTGENAKIVSHTEARLENGEIKGFTLVWPAGDEERRTRILGEMQASFERIDGVLDPAAGSNSAQSIDLLAGLELRKPKMARSGFFVDGNGTVVTTSEAVQGCSKITLEGDLEAQIVATDDSLGLAVLRPTKPLAPIRIAMLREGDARLQSDVAVSGYSYEGVLGAPTLTFGQLSDVRGLNGETSLKRLAMSALPGDAGGPVLDGQGSVIGMLLPRDGASTKALPEGVRFATGSDAIRTALASAGLNIQTDTPQTTLSAEDLARLGRDMTVLVSCWE
ncbi:serine protease [Shimia sp. SDUM112013]|uniref:serine protease n=1 Tax=Shimia sp. SDUM112013 TaxID=3136160 RepID=UPI0032EFB6EC